MVPSRQPCVYNFQDSSQYHRCLLLKYPNDFVILLFCVRVGRQLESCYIRTYQQPDPLHIVSPGYAGFTGYRPNMFFSPGAASRSHATFSRLDHNPTLGVPFMCQTKSWKPTHGVPNGAILYPLNHYTINWAPFKTNFLWFSHGFPMKRYHKLVHIKVQPLPAQSPAVPESPRTARVIWSRNHGHMGIDGICYDNSWPMTDPYVWHMYIYIP